MSTMKDKLNALGNVESVQRRALEKMYPYIDWSRMPFSSYGDFFRLRSILDDCGAVWTNAYGRSNGEAAERRRYLWDYAMPRHEGYAFDFKGGIFGSDTGVSAYSEDTVKITDSAIREDPTITFANFYASYKTFCPAKEFSFSVYGLNEGEYLMISYRRPEDEGEGISHTIYTGLSGGTHTVRVPASKGVSFRLVLQSSTDREITFRLLPGYRQSMDIELFNFGWDNGSGYGLFRDSFKWTALHSYIGSMCEYSVNADNTRLEVRKLKADAEGYYLYLNSTGDIPDTVHGRLRVSGLAALRKTCPDAVFKVMQNGDIKADGEYAYTYTKGGDTWFYCEIVPNTSVTEDIECGIVIEQIPDMPGCLVSDGVDDLGKCVGAFSLPEDYTVVAMREWTAKNNMAILIALTNAERYAPFWFEYMNGSLESTYSYGDNSTIGFPTLFSWQTKSSYNGKHIPVGRETGAQDTELTLFTDLTMTTGYSGAALYSFGVFTRTLTDDEMRTVRNCMFAEWIAMTGQLEGIEYYDILDARFRGNSEDADAREKWTGRMGKLHMTLYNYGFSGMSGWNGCMYQFKGSTSNGGEAEDNRVTITGKRYSYPANAHFRKGVLNVRISGLSVLHDNGEVIELRLQFNNEGAALADIRNFTEDGYYSIAVGDAPEGTTHIGFIIGYTGESLVPLSSPVVIDVLPDYPGALVGDSVDDHAESEAAIDEALGGFVCHGEVLGEKGYLFATSWGAKEVFIYKRDGRYVKGGNTTGVVESFADEEIPLVGLGKIPAVPDNVLTVCPSLDLGHAKSVLYQLRLLKSQPTGTQIEAVKWQMRKEHEDYLIHMGWNEADEQKQ